MLDLGPLRFTNQRPHYHARVGRVANLHLAGHSLGHLYELLSDRVVHQEARKQGAALAGVYRQTGNGAQGRALNVGVGPHDQSRFTAQFKVQTLQRRRSLGHDAHTHRF